MASRFLNNTKTAMLLGGLMGLCLLVGYALGGRQGLFVGLLFGGVGNIVSFFFSDKIAMTAMGGREMRREDLPWLFEMVERLTQRAGLPMPRVYLCPQAAPNAFATGRGPSHAAIGVTRGMLEFPREELEGVLAHELGHVKHRDMLISTIAAVMAGVISYAGYMFMFFGGGGDSRNNPFGAIGALLMLLLAPLAAGLIKMAISRQREFAADSFGGELSGDPLKLANALARLQNGNNRVPTNTNPAFHGLYIMQPLMRDKLASLFSSHPPTEARIAALRAQAQRMRG